MLYDFTFQPIRGSTLPSFTSSGSITSSAQALESSAANRTWNGPSGRTIRFSESSGEDYYVQFGTSIVVAVKNTSMLVLGAASEVFRLQPGQTHVAILSVSTSTAAVINMTLGTGR